MFKGKKAIYILIPINIAVWGFFIYRFYMAYNDYDEPQTSEKIANFKLDELKDSVTYQLALNYKDPFLKDVEKPKYSSNQNNLSSNNQNNKLVKTTVKTPTVTIPKIVPIIKYLGLVKNNSSGSSTALISVNGQSKLIKVNDVVDGITFKSFDRDNLVALWGKEKIVVRK